ncbi:SWIM zinc finger domain-containing protein [Pseudalkalibacillus sp. A8]|uniref:SWIM zinc finger family protein n=1 Tax=Pseudalkalibacillus sp. A8 TaxID=3382641 RepID=UPI0038B66ED1
MTRRNRITDSKLHHWLTQFTDGVDYGRFQRGMSLYNDHRIHGFQVFPNHFECKVNGIQAEYEVRCYFELEDGVPLLDGYEVTCSCPDETPICKHGVGATMYFVLDQLSSNEDRSGQQAHAARGQLIEEPLQELTGNIQRAHDSLLTLPDKRESRIIKNKMFIEKAHGRILDVMEELRKRNTE